MEHDENGRCLVCVGYMHCESCGLGVDEYYACEELVCGQLRCFRCKPLQEVGTE